MRTKYILPNEIEQIRHELEREDWLPLWIAQETGMRIGDILELRVENVDSGEIRYRAKKTGKDAVVSVQGALQRALSAKAEFEYRDRARRDVWLFPSPRDRRKHLTRQAVWWRVKRACRDAGLDPKGIAPHSFRKFFAVELFKREGLAAVQQALQHDRPSTTEIYALSDFTSGEAAFEPLLRRDLPVIVQEVLAALAGREPQTIHRC